ncbi:srf-type transcription factor [Gracilaria domingensis]|nr:srf-type transcription factor [Gracilaria domingensis]
METVTLTLVLFSALHLLFQGVLCDSEVAVIVYNPHNGKLFEYSSIPMERVLNRYATYSGPIERRKPEQVSTEQPSFKVLVMECMLLESNPPFYHIVCVWESQFFDINAARAHSNIPVNEPNVAMAAQNASMVASRRPRPPYKFEEELNLQEAKRRKLSSGETPTFEVPTSGIQIPHIVNKPVSSAVEPIASAMNTSHNMSVPSQIQAVPLSQIVQVPHPMPVVPPQYQPHEYGPSLIPPHHGTHSNFGNLTNTQPMYNTTPTISPLQCSSETVQSPNFVQPRTTENQIHQAARVSVPVDAYGSVPSAPVYLPASDHDQRQQFQEPAPESVPPTAQNMQWRQQSVYKEAQNGVEKQHQPVSYEKEASAEVIHHSVEQTSELDRSKERDEPPPGEGPVPNTDKNNLGHTEAQVEHMNIKQREKLGTNLNESKDVKSCHESLEKSLLSNKENEATENLHLPKIEVRRDDATLPTSSSGTLQMTPRSGPPPIPNISDALGSIPRLHIPPTPQGSSAWPALNSLSSNDGGNSVSLTRFFGLDSSSTRRRNRNPFTIPHNEIIPLTPRFFGLDTSSSTRSLFQSSNDTPFVQGSSDRENDEAGNAGQRDSQQR